MSKCVKCGSQNVKYTYHPNKAIDKITCKDCGATSTYNEYYEKYLTAKKKEE